MAENNQREHRSFFDRYKWYLIGLVAIIGFRAFSSSSDSATSSVVYDESEVVTPTEGVVTKLDEVQAEVFKITDEEVVPTVAESRIIANYMDGEVDTFTLEEIALVDTTIVSEDRGYRRRSGISTVVHYGLLGYMLGRPMGSPIRSSSYANRQSYAKAQTGSTRVSNSATRRTVRTPRPSSTGKSGYGSGRSTKSYGG